MLFFRQAKENSICISSDSTAESLMSMLFFFNPIANYKNGYEGAQAPVWSISWAYHAERAPQRDCVHSLPMHEPAPTYILHTKPPKAGEESQELSNRWSWFQCEETLAALLALLFKCEFLVLNTLWLTKNEGLVTLPGITIKVLLLSFFLILFDLEDWC